MVSAGWSGATYIVSNKNFIAKEVIDLIEKYQVTKTLLSPSHALILNSRNLGTKTLESLKSISCTGEKLSLETRKKYDKYLSPDCKFIYSYASSERSSMSFTTTNEYNESSGKLGPNISMKITDENGNQLGPNEHGEICIKRDIPWNGYYGDQKLTDEVYDPETLWYKTGDVGYFNEEGDLFVVHRLNEVIVVSPVERYEISPSEIEEHILKMPEVTDCCVVGIPDDANIHLIGALVVKAKGTDLVEESVTKFVENNMPICNRLMGGVYFVDSIPLTSTGKVLRREAVKIAQELYKRRM